MDETPSSVFTNLDLTGSLTSVRLSRSAKHSVDFVARRCTSEVISVLVGKEKFTLGEYVVLQCNGQLDFPANVELTPPCQVSMADYGGMALPSSDNSHAQLGPQPPGASGQHVIAASFGVIHYRRDGTTFHCVHCPYTTGNYMVMRDHYYRHHSSVLPYPCGFCAKAFASISQRNNHERNQHTGETPFACGHCHVAFTTSAARRRHLRAEHAA
ncbi:zinc finger protein-like [Tropilaelaps mercedesae]|uniref:Zinc finger protein-like n=1 Tax=Tropilaelaps mercedesae TaxID=418985 RepID=A0A1V9XMJ9_9ACAR|nr:zinc finger protein-like [Tropilaelaps mercedesae]